jgi:preprotein translocase subunit SecG
MYVLLTVLILLVCLLIMAVVLVQNPKGGGLGAGFCGSASNIMGVQKTGDILEKATWYLAVALLALSLTSALFIDRNEDLDAIRSGEATDQLYIPQNNTLPSVPTEGNE